jgi:hypothetical protein
MAPPHAYQGFKHLGQNSSLEPQVPRKRKAHLPVEYPDQAQLQQELAITGDRSTRLELAKAHYNAQIAAERKVQNDRIKRKKEKDKAEENGRLAQRAVRGLARRRSTSSLRSAANESTEPRTRSQVQKAAELVDSESYDGDDDDDEYRNSTS